jgi:Flp pilus assembly protein TadD
MTLARIIGAGLMLLLGACESSYVPKGDSYEAAVRQGDEARRAGNIDSAIPLYGRALEAKPNGLEAKLGLGQSYLALGAGEEAAAQFRDVLSKHGGEPTARRGLAAALISMGQPVLAEKQIDAALQADAQDYRALNLLGVSLDMQGRHAEAQANYRRGLEMAPDYVALRSNYGLSLAITGPPQEAVALLAPYAKSRIADAQVRQNLAFAYAMSGNMESALLISRIDLDERTAQRQLSYFVQLRALSPEQRSIEIRNNPMFMPRSRGSS